MLFDVLPDSAQQLAQLGDLIRVHYSKAMTVVLDSNVPTHVERLMQWRRAFLSQTPGFVTLGPCGPEFGRSLPIACHTCRPVRREAFHMTALYERFRKNVKEDDAATSEESLAWGSQSF